MNTLFFLKGCVCVCVHVRMRACVHHSCASTPRDQMNDRNETNSGPLQEHQGLFPAEPFLQAQTDTFFIPFLYPSAPLYGCELDWCILIPSSFESLWSASLLPGSLDSVHHCPLLPVASDALSIIFFFSTVDTDIQVKQERTAPPLFLLHSAHLICIHISWLANSF